MIINIRKLWVSARIRESPSNWIQMNLIISVDGFFSAVQKVEVTVLVDVDRAIWCIQSVINEQRRPMNIRFGIKSDIADGRRKREKERH